MLPSCVTESKFADDAVLYASPRDGLEAVASSFVCVARGWGLTVSLVKSKGIVTGIGADTSLLAPISVEGGVIELVGSFQYLFIYYQFLSKTGVTQKAKPVQGASPRFQYLGSIISSDGDLY